MLGYLPSPESAPFSSQLHLHPSPIQALGTPMDASASASASASHTSVSSASTSTVSLSRTYTAGSVDLVVTDEDQDQLAQVRRALHRSKSKSHSDLISSYFNNSEKTTGLCLTLRRCIAEARRLYRPIKKLFDDLPVDYLSESQCDLVFQEFSKFSKEDNPFPGPDSQTLDQIRDLFGVLNRQLDRRLRKSNSRIRFVSASTVGLNTICCSGAAITAFTPSKFSRRELAYAAQLEVASRSSYILKIGLDTLDILVRRLHNAVEGDKRFIQQHLGIMNDNYSVQEVLKELGKHQQKLGHDLDLLEEKITTCLITVNQSRSLLLEQILLHQSRAESTHSQ